MAITVLKNNVPWGPFTRAQIGDGLARGDFTLQYLAHAPGLKQWLPLGEVLDHFDRGANLPPVPTAADLRGLSGGRETPASAVLPPVPVASASARPPALPMEIRSRPEPISSPGPVSSTPPPPLEAPETALKKAPFFRRFFAFAIDCFVLFMPILFLFGVGALTIEIQGTMQHSDPETMRQEWILLRRNFEDLLLAVIFGGAWLYGALLECSHWQATVGKQWAGLKVTDTQGRQISFFHATGRHAAKFISALPCFLGFTMAFFSPRGLALHDRLARTRVLRK